MNDWPDVQPGDIGFDGGKGIFGWLIRRATGSRGHCWVYVQLLGVAPSGAEIWLCDEAGPRGIRERRRESRPLHVARLWRNSREQHDILSTSKRLLGQPYSWREIFRIAIYKLTGHTWATDPNGYICSGHVATTIVFARPDLAHRQADGMPHPAHRIWPDALATWSDTVTWREHVLPNTEWQKAAAELLGPVNRYPA